MTTASNSQNAASSAAGSKTGTSTVSGPISVTVTKDNETINIKGEAGTLSITKNNDMSGVSASGSLNAGLGSAGGSISIKESNNVTSVATTLQGSNGLESATVGASYSKDNITGATTVSGSTEIDSGRSPREAPARHAGRSRDPHRRPSRG